MNSLLVTIAKFSETMLWVDERPAPHRPWHQTRFPSLLAAGRIRLPTATKKAKEYSEPEQKQVVHEHGL